jgi:hypothetical protein
MDGKEENRKQVNRSGTGTTPNVQACMVVIIITVILSSGAQSTPPTDTGMSGNPSTIFVEANRYTDVGMPVDLNAIYTDARVIFSVPEVHLPKPKGMKGYFEDVEHRIFDFKGTGYGEFGRQIEFADGTTNRTLICPQTDSTASVTFLLPENATVVNASLEVMSIEKVLNWTEPGYLNEDIDGNQLPLLALGQISADFADLDSDGDLDMVKGGWSTVYNETKHIYTNIGGPKDPLFAYSSRYSENITMTIKANPRFVDIDADGDSDLFIGETNGNLSFYRNNGTVKDPVWNREPFLQGYIFGIENCPDFVDLDDDGDYDLVVGQKSPSDALLFFRNVGSPTTPLFVEETMFQDVSLGNVNYPAFCDYDLDGDFDLFLGHWQAPITYFENIGTPTTPSWGGVQRIDETEDLGYYLAPSFADLDGDAYQDMVIGTHHGNLRLFIRDVSFPQAPTVVIGDHEQVIDLGQEPRIPSRINITEGVDEVLPHLESSIDNGYLGLSVLNMTVSTDRIGGLVLANLSVDYTLEVLSPDFSSALNAQLDEVRMDNPGEGTVNTTLVLFTDIQGHLSIEPILVPHYPLRIDRIGNATVPEDSRVEGLLDLYDSIKYDFEFDDLSIEVRSIHPNINNIMIDDGRYLCVDNTRDQFFDNWTGSQEMWVVVSDPRGFTAISNVFSISTLPVNDPPAITSIPVSVAYEDRLYKYPVVAVDGDGDVLEYTIVEGPADATVVPQGVLRWLPTSEELGENVISLGVSDGMEMVVQTYSLFVMNTNDPPVILGFPDVVATKGSMTRVDWTEHVFDEDTPVHQMTLDVNGTYVDVDGYNLIIDYPLDCPLTIDDVPVTLSDGQYTVSGTIAIHLCDPSVSLLEIDTVYVFADRETKLDLRPYIRYDGDYGALRVTVDSPFIDVNGFILTIQVPSRVDEDELRYLLGVSDGHDTTFGFLELKVVDGDGLLIVPRLPVQFAIEDSVSSFDLDQYISTDVSREDIAINSDSVHFTGSDGASISVFYSYPVPADVMMCDLILPDGRSTTFNVTVYVHPTNDVPEQVLNIADITLEHGERYSLRLSDHFYDEDGDQLAFRTDYDFCTLDPSGDMIIENVEGDGDHVCRITVYEVGNESSYVISNEFNVTLRPGSGHDGLSGLLLTILVVCVVAAVAATYYWRHGRSVR